MGAFSCRAPQGYSYGWTRDGAAIPGATSSTLVAGSAGEYACQVTAHNHAGAATQTSAPHAVSSPPPPVCPDPTGAYDGDFHHGFNSGFNHGPRDRFHVGFQRGFHRGFRSLRRRVP